MTFYLSDSNIIILILF